MKVSFVILSLKKKVFELANYPKYFNQKHFNFCCEVVKKVLDFKQTTSSIIFLYFKSHGKEFGSKERKMITDIVFSIVRNKSYFLSLIQEDQIIKYNSNELRCLVVLGAISKLNKNINFPFLTDQEKNLFSNIVIKSIRGVYEEFSHSPLLNEKLSVPSWIFNDWVNQRNKKNTINLIESNHSDFPIYCRVNILRRKIKDVATKIKDFGLTVDQSGLIQECLKFPPGTNVNNIQSLFSSGEIEIQDLGSQIIAKLVAPKRHQTIIDFCAGTGGKTLALGTHMKNTGKIFAFDISAERIIKLKKRVSSSGLKNVWPIVIRNLYDEKLAKFVGKVDSVLVDAPCSGLGTLRRNPDLKWRVTKAEIANISKKQLDILTKASSLCKVGGYLVYATCSTIYGENECVVKEFLLNNGHFDRCNSNFVFEKQNIIFDKSWNVFDSYGNIHIWTDLTDTDSFFMSRLIRTK